MSGESSVKKNYLYNAAYQLLLVVVPLLTAPYISRKLGPDMIGQQSYVYSIATYFMLFIMLGVNNYGNRSVARTRDNKKEMSKVFWTIYGFQLFRAAIIFAIYCLTIFLFDSKYTLLAIVNGIYVFSGLLDINWFFFGIEKFKITVTRNIIIKIASVVCIFVFIKKPDDIWKYSLIVSMVALVSNGYLWFYLRKFVDLYRPKFREFIPHIKPELILFIPVIAASLYKVMDRIMLGMFSTTVEVGYYTQSESVINLPMSLITALGTVMLPRISNLLSRGNTEETHQYIESSISFAVMLSSAMMFGLMAIAPTFVPVFFGDGYAPCVGLIMGLSITMLFISWANVIRTQYLIPNSKDKSYVLSIIIGAVINLIINYTLIPRLQSRGALIGTICAEMIVCLLQTIWVRKDLPIGHYMKISYPFIIFGALMFLIVRLVSHIQLRPILLLGTELITGVAAYVILLIIYSTKSNTFVARTIRQYKKRFLGI